MWNDDDRHCIILMVENATLTVLYYNVLMLRDVCEETDIKAFVLGHKCHKFGLKNYYQMEYHDAILCSHSCPPEDEADYLWWSPHFSTSRSNVSLIL